jgi:hypothetical protein
VISSMELRGLHNFIRSWGRDARTDIVGFLFGVARSEQMWRGMVWGLAGSQAHSARSYSNGGFVFGLVVYVLGSRLLILQSLI